MIRYLLSFAGASLLSLGLLSAAFAKTPPSKKSKPTAKATHSVSKGGRSVHATHSSSRATHGRHYIASHHHAPASSWRNRQLAPTSDRYREIQEALASKGYLKSAPNGSWDAESQDALKRFQADQNLEQTGKVNSISLIALGLGPAKSSGVAPPAATPGSDAHSETPADEPKQTQPDR